MGPALLPDHCCGTNESIPVLGVQAVSAVLALRCTAATVDAACSEQVGAVPQAEQVTPCQLLSFMCSHSCPSLLDSS